MGEVYRARDTRLDRDVAIKALPPQFADDLERLARFEREAKVLASLSHRHIATIYGLEETTGTKYLVLEFIAGESLADRLKRGSLPIDEALAIARQICDAVEAAHGKGIIHRDLKPANIMLTRDGQVKVLDFGLARVAEPDADVDHGNSPTITAVGTQLGVILGTAAYMSPEQARGQRVDPQTDIWAFGCVLYELLTGRAAFGRATLTETMAAVIESEPDWTALPRSTPSGVVRLLRRTLEKNPTRRLHAIADARIDLDEVPETMPPSAVTSSRSSARPLMLGAAVVAVVLLFGVGWLLLHGSRPPAQVPTRVSITAPGQVLPQLSVAVSPDGRQLVYVSTDAAGGARLWVRDLDALAPRVLAGTEDAAHPFWKPDGSAIGFVAQGKLKRVDAKGGQVSTLVDGATRSGASWSSTGVILFKLGTGDLDTIPEAGGQVSTVLKGAQSVDWPSFLADGRHFVFFRRGADNVRGVYVGSLGSETTKLVMPGDFQAVFVPPDYLLFARDEGLVFAQHFDLDRLELTGNPVAVAEGVWSFRPADHVSVSAVGGVLAYVNATVSNTALGWFDRSGLALGTIGKPGWYDGLPPRISPDATRVAFSQHVGSGEVWVTTLGDGTSRRLTLDRGATGPIWSSDGGRILFTWTGPAGGTASIQDARGNTPESLVGPVGGAVWDWSPDGQWIVVGRNRPMDLFLLPVAAPGDAVQYSHSGFNKTQAHVSPDGRWMAYTSYESGRDEVYVDSFPTAGNRRQVSVGGGMQPRWRRNGSELFYLAPDQVLMTVPVTSGPGRFDLGRAMPLFRTRLVPTGSQIAGWSAMYDVTADGQRFLLNGPPADPGPPITVVLNWSAGVK
jgi:Tol biopolymer transport system component